MLRWLKCHLCFSLRDKGLVRLDRSTYSVHPKTYLVNAKLLSRVNFIIPSFSSHSCISRSNNFLPCEFCTNCWFWSIIILRSELSGWSKAVFLPLRDHDQNTFSFFRSPIFGIFLADSLTRDLSWWIFSTKVLARLYPIMCNLRFFTKSESHCHRLLKWQCVRVSF